MAAYKDDIKIKNKKASFEYEFLDKLEAGIQLLGTEIKSIRMNKANIQEAYCYFIGHELWIKNMHISEYDFGNVNNHEPKRERKLLLKKRELSKLKKELDQKGLTLIPTLLFINSNGKAKINIALAKGKKLYDKRESLKKQDSKRDIDRIKKDLR